MVIQVIADELRVEYQKCPLDIEVYAPRFMWVMNAKGCNKRQTKYQLQVFLKDRMIWDSQIVCDSRSMDVPYRGEPLEDCSVYTWRVKIWDEKDQESDWSESWFETAFLKEFESNFIYNRNQIQPEKANISLPAAYFRRVFQSRKEICRARLYIASLGLYQVRINGAYPIQSLIAPDWTDYNKRLYYQTYDVTKLLHRGENVLGVIVGDGWYTGHIAHCGRKNYGDYPLKLYAKLLIEYTDQTVEILDTDSAWKTSFGMIRRSDLLMGEYYDARYDLGDWDKSGYDDSGWENAEVSRNDQICIMAQKAPVVQRAGEIEPIEMWQTDVDTYVYDMGQNFAGRVILKVQGERGQKITIRYGEEVYPLMYENRRLYTENLRGAAATDIYVLKGEETEYFEPSFTYHGFRYVEVSGLGKIPSIDQITGVIMHSDLKETGKFRCSNPLINRLYQNILWSQRSNFFSVPTDCPQRDERMGWLGDAQVFSRTACYNMESKSFFEKYLKDCRDAQEENGLIPMVAPNMRGMMTKSAAAWSEAVIIIPWVLYNFYGDKKVISDHYDMMLKWQDYIAGKNPDLICEDGGFGDWLEVHAHTPSDVVNTAYFAYGAYLISKISGILGKRENEQKYKKLFESIKAAFQKKFVDENGVIYGNTQTCYLLALKLSLIDEEKKQRAAENLVKLIAENNYRLTTGFIGVSFLLPTLCDYGYPDVAYKLLESEEYPSWLYSVVNGATTVWERWNSKIGEHINCEQMNSFNHYSLGSVGEWLYAYCCGIRYKEPGFRCILIEPVVTDTLSFAEAEYRSIYGKISVKWERQADHQYRIEVQIPHNTTAEVVLGKEHHCIGSGKYVYQWNTSC